MSIEDRIRSAVLIDENDCWIWQRASASSTGYGRMRIPGGRSDYTHRVSYEAFVGPIPQGLVIDHLCRVTKCCNPAHLQAVRQQTNTLRGEGPAARNARKTHCPQGHPYDEQRRCRECKRKRDAGRQR
jgi:hypothetical protein